MKPPELVGFMEASNHQRWTDAALWRFNMIEQQRCIRQQLSSSECNKKRFTVPLRAAQAQNSPQIKFTIASGYIVCGDNASFQVQTLKLSSRDSCPEGFRAVLLLKG
jgi:hypothetical protein